MKKIIIYIKYILKKIIIYIKYILFLCFLSTAFSFLLFALELGECGLCDCDESGYRKGNVEEFYGKQYESLFTKKTLFRNEDKKPKSQSQKKDYVRKVIKKYMNLYADRLSYIELDELGALSKCNRKKKNQILMANKIKKLIYTVMINNFDAIDSNYNYAIDKTELESEWLNQFRYYDIFNSILYFSRQRASYASYAYSKYYAKDRISILDIILSMNSVKFCRSLSAEFSKIIHVLKNSCFHGYFDHGIYFLDEIEYSTICHFCEKTLKSSAQDIKFILSWMQRRVINNDEIELGQIQIELKYLGYDPGEIDGLWGAHTKNAINQFQLDSGLLSTSKLDSKTKTKLNAKTNEYRLKNAECTKLGYLTIRYLQEEVFLEFSRGGSIVYYKNFKKLRDVPINPKNTKILKTYEEIVKHVIPDIIEEVYEPCLNISRKTNHKYNEGKFLCYIGNAYRLLRKIKRSEHYLQEALKILKELQSPYEDTAQYLIKNVNYNYPLFTDMRRNPRFWFINNHPDNLKLIDQIEFPFERRFLNEYIQSRY